MFRTVPLSGATYILRLCGRLLMPSRTLLLRSMYLHLSIRNPESPGI